MKKNTTYSPQDIEDLLLNKSFDELNEKEQEFALTQVENEQEYKEMRNTLISVKQIAAEQESVYVPNRIKEDLMQLMEKKKKPLGWFSLNSIGAFLFPSNTPLFKKPGLQLATVGLMLLLVVNIGIDTLNQPNKELAINTNQISDREELEKDNKIIEEKTEKEPILIDKVSDKGTFPNLNKEIIEKENSNSAATNEVEVDLALQGKLLVQDKTNYFDLSDVKVEEIVEVNSDLDDVTEKIKIEKPQEVSVPSVKLEKNKSDYKEVAEVEMDEEVKLSKVSRAENVTVTLNSNSGDSKDSYTFSDAVEGSSKAKKATPKLQSQSLGDNSDVIDLLFVTL